MRRPGGGFCALVGVYLFVLLLFPMEVDAQYNFSKIALTGELTDVVSAGGGFGGPDSSVRFLSLENSVVLTDGTIGFRGLVGTDQGSEEGIWSKRSIDTFLRTVARENQYDRFVDAQFASSNTERVFSDLKLLQGAFITFHARLQGAGITPENDTSAYRWLNAPLTDFIYLREGYPYSGGQFVDDLFNVDASVQETAFRRFNIRGAPANQDSGYHFGPDLVREGFNSLPDVSAARPVQVGADGIVLYRARSADTDSIHTEFGARRVIEGQLTEVISGVRLGDLYQPATGSERVGNQYDNAQRFLYAARLTGTGVSGNNDSAVFVQSPSSTAPQGVVAREGNHVPGRPAEVLFGDLGTDNVIGGGLRSVLFNAALTGTGIDSSNDWVLVGWSPAANNMRIVAQEGQHVEGLPVGAVLTDLTGSNFQLNELGRAIFNAPFDGPGGDGLGMFWADPDAIPRTIVYTGQDFDIGGGVFRTISDIGLMELAGAMDGRGSQINSAGTIVFTLDFTDGSSGVFAVQVPEPATTALAVLALVGLAVVARRLYGRA